MKKLLGLFCVVALLSACSSTGSNGGLFGGSECDSRDARNFMANAEDRVFFAFDSSSPVSYTHLTLPTILLV